MSIEGIDVDHVLEKKIVQKIIHRHMKIAPYFIHLCLMLVRRMVQQKHLTQRNNCNGYATTLT